MLEKNRIFPNVAQKVAKADFTKMCHFKNIWAIFSNKFAAMASEN